MDACLLFIDVSAVYGGADVLGNFEVAARQHPAGTVLHERRSWICSLHLWMRSLH